jgi:hypothetical protein
VRRGGVIVVHTLDRLGRGVRNTLNLIHDLSERVLGLRNLADPIRVDSSRPEDPMAQLAIILLALFGQLERTSGSNGAPKAAKGHRVGRPSVVDADRLAYEVAPVVRTPWVWCQWSGLGLAHRRSNVTGLCIPMLECRRFGLYQHSPLEDGVGKLIPCLPLLRVEEFELQSPPERLHHRVIVTVAHAAH